MTSSLRHHINLIISFSILPRLGKRNIFHFSLEAWCRPRGVLWHFCTYVGSGYIFGLKILNFNIFLGFQKNKYFGGYEEFVDIFWGYHRKIGLYLGVISMHFMVFS